MAECRTLQALKNTEHPWGQFLYARSQAILWMKNEMKRSNFEIANALSMDEMQVQLILMTIEDK